MDLLILKYICIPKKHVQKRWAWLILYWPQNGMNLVSVEVHMNWCMKSLLVDQHWCVPNRMLLMCLFLLLQQCLICLVCLTWVVCKMEGKWQYNCCLVGCCLCTDTRCSMNDLPGVMDDRNGWREGVREICYVSVTWLW